MAVCQYFIRGQCRFGDHCRNEHPANPRGVGGSSSGFGNQTWTNAGPSTSSATGHAKAPVLPFTHDSIKADLSSDKPIWPLSTYGPAKYEPNVLVGLDESAEELRVRAVLALKAGNVNEYTMYESSKMQAATQTYDNARNNLNQVYQTAANQSPHSTKPTTATATATSAFGSNSTAAPTTSAFGQTGFGSTQPQQQQQQPTSAFGQPSQPGQGSTSVFGQPTQAPQSAFGALSKPPTTLPTTGGTTGGTMFGQTAFGQPSQPAQSVFGQTSGPSSSSMIKPASGAFSAFAGNAGANASPFAAAAAAVNQNQNQSGGNNPTGGGGGGFSAFAGQPSAFGALTGASTGTGTTSVFGQPAAAGAPVSVFGQPQQPQQPTSAFGGLQTQPTSAFGGGAGGFGAFANPSSNQPQSAFGALQAQTQPATTANTQSVFGQLQPQNPPQSVFGSGGAFSGGGNASSNPLNPLNAAPSSVFTPLSNPLNPLNNANTNNNANNQNPFGMGTGGGGFGALNPQQSPFTTASTISSPFTSTTTTIFPPSVPSSGLATAGSTGNPLTNPSTRPNFMLLIHNLQQTSRTNTATNNQRTPYDALLPPNYARLLPEPVVTAFEGVKFEFGKVPEWVPPVEFR